MTDTQQAINDFNAAHAKVCKDFESKELERLRESLIKIKSMLGIVYRTREVPSGARILTELVIEHIDSLLKPAEESHDS